jgi:hypothetical protein
VPEASINKNNHTLLAKNKIGLTRQLLLAAPTGYARRTKKRDESQFRFLIAVAANERHDLGAFFFGPDVWHLL